MVKQCILSIGVMMLVAGASAQTVLLEQDVNQDTVEISKGPNYKNYAHWYLDYGFVIGESEGDGADVKMWNSSNFAIGLRYKRKLSNFYAVGFDISYASTRFHIAQDSGKIFPNNVLHDKERLSYNDITLQLYQRFNFGKRGNHIGKYLDLGGYGAWGYSIKHYTRDEHKVANNANADVTETTNKKLIYTNPVNYGAIVRIGMSKLGVFGKYRLSDMFRNTPSPGTNTPYPELPRLVVGLEISIIT